MARIIVPCLFLCYHLFSELHFHSSDWGVLLSLNHNNWIDCWHRCRICDWFSVFANQPMLWKFQQIFVVQIFLLRLVIILLNELKFFRRLDSSSGPVWIYIFTIIAIRAANLTWSSKRLHTIWFTIGFGSAPMARPKIWRKFYCYQTIGLEFRFHFTGNFNNRNNIRKCPSHCRTRNKKQKINFEIFHLWTYEFVQNVQITASYRWGRNKTF